MKCRVPAYLRNKQQPRHGCPQSFKVTSVKPVKVTVHMELNVFKTIFWRKKKNENNVNMWLIQLWICVLQMYYYVINESFNMWSSKEWLCLKKWQCMMCKSVKTWIKECQIDKDSMACSYRLIKLFVCDWQQVNNKKLGYVTSVVVVSMLFMQNWSTERDVGKETVANRHAHVKAISQANTMGV